MIILIIVAATSPTKDDVRVDKVNCVTSIPGVWQIGQHLVVIMITRIIIIIYDDFGDDEMSFW